ncbi:hypothetical protein [Ktedonobacter racemifer]|nr:hypothetical protein [Ktedonobacter racemifer]
MGESWYIGQTSTDLKSASITGIGGGHPGKAAPDGILAITTVYIGH